ncbi:hypothetical protein D9M72_552220 [compost metagenome]
MADPAGGSLHQGRHLAGFAHHFGKARGGDHDEADHGHHLHALGEQVIRFLPAHHTRQRENHEAQQRADDHRVQPELHHERDQDGHASHAEAHGVVANAHLFGPGDALQVIGALAAIADEHCDEQTGNHAQRRYQHRLGDIHASNVDATFHHIRQQDLVQEDAAKAHRQEHVGRDQTEGDHAGDQPAVDGQPRQYI